MTLASSPKRRHFGDLVPDVWRRAIVCVRCASTLTEGCERHGAMRPDARISSAADVGAGVPGTPAPRAKQPPLLQDCSPTSARHRCRVCPAARSIAPGGGLDQRPHEQRERHQRVDEVEGDAERWVDTEAAQLLSLVPVGTAHELPARAKRAERLPYLHGSARAGSVRQTRAGARARQASPRRCRSRGSIASRPRDSPPPRDTTRSPALGIGHLEWRAVRARR